LKTKRKLGKTSNFKVPQVKVDALNDAIKNTNLLMILKENNTKHNKP
jgi:hypothetical protein